MTAIDRTVLVVLGTRPEAIKLAPIIAELRTRKQLRTVVCSTGQHREMLDQALSVFDIGVDVDLKVMKPNQDLLGLTTAVLTGVASVISDTSPDLVMVQGDTTSAMASGLAASIARVPIGHVEAGLRTFDKFNPYPEENNRVIIDAIADLLFAATQTNVDNLTNMGIAAETIFLTGNTVVDSVLSAASSLDRGGTLVDDLIESQVPGAIRNLSSQKGSPRKLILVTAHRRESFGPKLESIFESLKQIVERNPDVDIAFPVHLNPEVSGPAERMLGGVERIHMFAPTQCAFVRLLYRNSIRSSRRSI